MKDAYFNVESIDGGTTHDFIMWGAAHTNSTHRKSSEQDSGVCELTSYLCVCVAVKFETVKLCLQFSVMINSTFFRVQTKNVLVTPLRSNAK